MAARSLTGERIAVVGSAPPLLGAALAAAGAVVVADLPAPYLVAAGDGIDAALASCTQMPELKAVLLLGDARRLALAAELLPGQACYWAQRFAPRVRVNGLLLSGPDDASALAELAAYLLAEASFTTGLTLTLDGAARL